MKSKTYIGRFAIGIKKDKHSNRETFKSPFNNGSKTKGIIKRYDPRKQQYYIEGININFKGEEEIKGSGNGDWYYRSQIKLYIRIP